MSNQTNLSALIGSAGLDASATSAMELTADTLGPAIMAGLGDVSLDDIGGSEVVLVTLLLDDSGSISSIPGNPEAVRIGHNTVLDALLGSKQSGDVLISCRYLNDNGNGGVLYPYRPLSGAVRLDSGNYNPIGGTPLYDQTAVTLTAVTAKLAEFEAGGVAARAISIIVTDGSDQHSRHHDAASINNIVAGLLRTEQHIIAGMGISDGYTDFRRVFGEMGILDQWILTPGNTPGDIRQAFAVVSQSAVRASQSAGSFSQTGLGGFGTP